MQLPQPFRLQHHKSRRNRGTNGKIRAVNLVKQTPATRHALTFMLECMIHIGAVANEFWIWSDAGDVVGRDGAVLDIRVLLRNATQDGFRHSEGFCKD